MLFLFGTKTVEKDVPGSSTERAHCTRCGLISDFRRRTRREYFTAYMLPVFPISKPEFITVCNRCGASYYSTPQASNADSERTVLHCPRCSGKLGIPSKLDNAIRVTCPHCRDQFTVSVSKT